MVSDLEKEVQHLKDQLIHSRIKSANRRRAIKGLERGMTEYRLENIRLVRQLKLSREALHRSWEWMKPRPISTPPQPEPQECETCQDTREVEEFSETRTWMSPCPDCTGKRQDKTEDRARTVNRSKP